MKIVRSSSTESEEEGGKMNLIPLIKDYSEEVPEKIASKNKKAQKEQETIEGRQEEMVTRGEEEPQDKNEENIH